MNEPPERMEEVARWIEGRYPGDWEPITVAEAQRALEMAQVVRQAVLRHLP